MSQPTKEQWGNITRGMDSIYTSVYLRCDDYLLTTRMARNKNKLEIDLFINGVLKGKWFGFYKQEDELSDIQRRFCQASVSGVWPRKIIREMEKILGKRMAKEQGYYNTRIIVKPVWSSAKRLVSHLKKHNKNIELLSYEEHKLAIDALPKEDAA